MTCVIAETYDSYSTPGDAITGNKWTGGAVGNSSLSTKTRFGVGQSMKFNSFFGEHLDKYFGSNQAVWYIHMPRMCPDAITIGGTATTDYFSLWDGDPNSGGTEQCCVGFTTGGGLNVLRGGPGGTVVASFSNVWVPNSFDSFQVEVVVNGSTGSVEVRKNGAVSGANVWSATGLNIRSSANNYADAIRHGAIHGGQFSDHFFACVDDGVAPNGWTGDMRVQRRQGASDTAQKQWTQNSSGSLALNWGIAGGFTDGHSANVLYMGCTGGAGSGSLATQGGMLTSASVAFGSGFTGHAKLAAYLLDGDTTNFNSDTLPGTLVGVSDEVTNPSATQTFTFSTNAPIKKGFRYAYALLSDAAWNASNSGGIGDRTSSYIAGISYAGGFPASLIGAPPATTNDGGHHLPVITATLSANNAGCVNDESQDGGTTYLSDGTVNDYDLYNIEAAPFVPSAIQFVQLCSTLAKSDAGGCGIKVRGRSGGTTFETPEYFPLTTYGKYDTVFANDPNTGLPWTAAAVDALLVGPLRSS